MAAYDYGGGCPCGLYRECPPGCQHYVKKEIHQGFESAQNTVTIPAKVVQKIECRVLAFHYAVMADAAERLNVDEKFVQHLRATSQRFKIQEEKL